MIFDVRTFVAKGTSLVETYSKTMSIANETWCAYWSCLLKYTFLYKLLCFDRTIVNRRHTSLLLTMIELSFDLLSLNSSTDSTNCAQLFSTVFSRFLSSYSVLQRWAIVLILNKFGIYFNTSSSSLRDIMVFIGFLYMWEGCERQWRKLRFWMGGQAQWIFQSMARSIQKYLKITVSWPKISESCRIGGGSCPQTPP